MHVRLIRPTPFVQKLLNIYVIIVLLNKLFWFVLDCLNLLSSDIPPTKVQVFLACTKVQPPPALTLIKRYGFKNGNTRPSLYSCKMQVYKYMNIHRMQRLLKRGRTLPSFLFDIISVLCHCVEFEYAVSRRNHVLQRAAADDLYVLPGVVALILAVRARRRTPIEEAFLDQREDIDRYLEINNRRCVSADAVWHVL
jgi:hypothetical protein